MKLEHQATIALAGKCLHMILNCRYALILHQGMRLHSTSFGVSNFDMSSSHARTMVEEGLLACPTGMIFSEPAGLSDAYASKCIVESSERWRDVASEGVGR